MKRVPRTPPEGLLRRWPGRTSGSPEGLPTTSQAPRGGAPPPTRVLPRQKPLLRKEDGNGQKPKSDNSEHDDKDDKHDNDDEDPGDKKEKKLKRE